MIYTLVISPAPIAKGACRATIQTLPTNQNDPLWIQWSPASLKRSLDTASWIFSVWGKAILNFSRGVFASLTGANYVMTTYLTSLETPEHHSVLHSHYIQLNLAPCLTMNESLDNKGCKAVQHDFCSLSHSVFLLYFIFIWVCLRDLMHIWVYEYRGVWAYMCLYICCRLFVSHFIYQMI